MKGAVQGAATATASTPVKAAPNAPPRSAASAWPAAACKLVPASNTPERFSATSSMTRVRPATMAGDCS